VENQVARRFSVLALFHLETAPCPEGALQFGHAERGTRGDLCLEGGYRTQPRASTLGTPKINEFALKLKGREAEQINLALIAAQKLECAIETFTIQTLLSRC
jgi:hypothetical protein